MSVSIKSRSDSLQIIEIPDTVPPIVTSVSLDYSDGILVITAIETVLSRPSSIVNVSKMFLENATGDRAVWLDGADVVEGLSVDITIKLTEYQRASALKYSGAIGGDGNGILLTAEQGSFADMEFLPNNATEGFEIAEKNDTVIPNITFVLFDYNSGMLVLIFLK